jgi:hypothetical protein
MGCGRRPPKGKRARHTPRANEEPQPNLFPKRARTLVKEDPRAHRGGGVRGASQPRRRGHIFDSTLGFPGEGPSQTAGAKQDRPRVIRGHALHQKVISLPSQAVSLFVRTGRNTQLTQGPPSPDLPHSCRTGRQLFPSTTQDETRYPTPDCWVEDNRTAERISDDAPQHDSTEPLSGHGPTDRCRTNSSSCGIAPGRLPTPDIAIRNPEQPFKRQKTRTTAENEIPLAGARSRLEEPAAATVRLPLETDSERKVFIKKFGAKKGLTVPVLEAIWQERKHGYHKPYDAPRMPISTGHDTTWRRDRFSTPHA